MVVVNVEKVSRHKVKMHREKQSSRQTEAALTIDGTTESIAHWLEWRWPMPHYFFDTKDGHRLVHLAGSDCKNDSAAMEKARILAIGGSLDKPAVDPTRRISVLNADKVEISTVPVYSKPA
jgi:hypothetical protein